MPTPQPPHPGRLPAAERYRIDAQFASVVDMLTALMGQGQFTATEVREAAVFALMRYEMLYGPAPAPLVTLQEFEAMTGQRAPLRPWLRPDPEEPTLG